MQTVIYQWNRETDTGRAEKNVVAAAPEWRGFLTSKTVYRGQHAAARGIPEQVLRLLPAALAEEIRRAGDAGAEQLDLHVDGLCTLTIDGRTRCLEAQLTAPQARALIEALCDGSTYAAADTIRAGYLSLPGGVRVGVCGHARREGGRLLDIDEVGTFVFRFPHAVSLEVGFLRGLLRSHPGRGVLVWSPPGVGKTTFLREAIRLFAARPHPWRVAAVDTREELCAPLSGEPLCLHSLLGYARGEGIAIATRTLAAQLIVCDEIGGREEAEAMREALGAGIPLLASAHGGSLSEVLARPGLRELCRDGIFGSFLGLSRPAGGQMNVCTVSAEEIFPHD